MTRIPDDEFKLWLTRAAMAVGATATDEWQHRLIRIAMRAAQEGFEEDELINELADMVVSGHLAPERLGSLGDDPRMVKAVADRLINSD